MTYKIVWSKDAGEEFSEIVLWHKYNAGVNSARKTYIKINSQIKKFKDMPGIGKPVQILKNIGVNDYRQIAMEHWVIYYKIEGQAINVVSIIDGRRNLEEILYKKIINNPAASREVCCSLKELDSGVNTFLTAPRRGVSTPSPRINGKIK
jgi:toxin ParE1/3/4